MKPPIFLTGLSLTLLLPGVVHAQDAEVTCAALAAQAFTDADIRSAELVRGSFGTDAQAAEVPDFCRVVLNVEPAIGIEVWLPAADAWNGRYLAVGGGGFAGVISYNAMIPAIRAGYVTSSTDTGHVSPDLEWLTDEGRMRDYGYRAIHEMARKSRALIASYYAREPDYSYFNGCSTGGRQGLMEAQRFPGDFDGIVSGAPVNHFTATHYTQLWISKAAKPVNDTLLPVATLSLVTRAVLERCDALDGVRDGVLEDPRQCDFQPASLRCEAGETQSCLSDEQVEALERIYDGPRHAETGERLHWSLMPGSESPEGFEGNWILTSGNELAPIPQAFFSRAVFQNSDWNWRDFDFANDIAESYRRTGHLLEATSPNLDAFQSGGGKLILYHGWDDNVIFPEGTIAYYESIIDSLPMSDHAEAASKTAEFARLFMVPGMSHCRGGPGTDTFDMQAAIEAWVEQGQAPEMIPASHVRDGTVTRTRPLCPYPEVASYNGTGSIDDIGSFVCAVPTR